MRSKCLRQVLVGLRWLGALVKAFPGISPARWMVVRDGVDPSTSGFSDRQTSYPSVSSGRVLRGNIRVSESPSRRFVSSCAAPYPSRRLQIGLHLCPRDLLHTRCDPFQSVGLFRSVLVDHVPLANRVGRSSKIEAVCLTELDLAQQPAHSRFSLSPCP